MNTWVTRYAALSMRRPWLLLALYALITALAGWRGTRIEVDPGLEALLPEDAPSVIALEEARSRRGSQDLFVIAVQSPEPLATVQFVDALAEAFADWEEVEYVDYVRDQSFFREHVLLYLPAEDLERIESNLRRMIRQRLGKEHPLFEDLESTGDTEEEVWDWRDWREWIDPHSLVELGIEEDGVGALFPFLNEANSEDTAAASAPPDDEAQRIREARWNLPDEYADYRIAPHGGVAIFAAKLRGRSTNIEYARQVYEHAEEVIAELDPSSFHPELRAQVAGAYQSFLEVRAITRDASVATQISIVLILLLLVAFFRNLRAIYIVLLPLLVGTVWTLGFLELVYGHLNTLTVFVFSILIGMGIDYSIHIYGRLMGEWRAGKSMEEAAAIAIGRTGRALMTAAATTVASLLVLLLASFDGFREFGVACGIGVAICFASAALLIPPLVGASERVRPLRLKPVSSETRSAGRRRRLLGGLRVGAVALVVLGIAGVASAPGVEFEHDFGNLSAPPDPNKIRYGAALGQGRSSAPAVMLGRDEAQMREVHAELSRRLREGDPLIRGFTTIATAVPSPEDQQRRLEVIDRIYSVLDRRAVQRIDGDEGEVIAEITRLTEVEPFDATALPQWALQQIVERDGSYGSLGLLIGEYDSDDARDVRRFQESYAHIDVESGRVAISSSGFIIADVVRYVQADAVYLTILVILAIIAILALDMRNVAAVAVCMCTFAVAAGLTVLGMRVFDIKLGLFNVVVLPTVLGVGIDGTVHLYHRYCEEGRHATGEVVATTGVAIVASSLTTIAGFVGLVMVPHQGIQTLGALAVLGIVASLLCSIFLVPALIGRDGAGADTAAK